jgi:hypothetical protein
MGFWRRLQSGRAARQLHRRRGTTAYDQTREPTAIGAAVFGDQAARPSTPRQVPATSDAGLEPAADSSAALSVVAADTEGVRDPRRQTVELRLMHAEDMFEMPQTDLFSEYRNFLTGIDFCISELRARHSRRPVRLEIHLPRDEIDDQAAERMGRTLRRYCKHRMRYNRRETRALRWSGISALRVGLPVSAVGFVMVGVATGIKPSGGALHLIIDHLGWVLLWLGLWFPLDEFLFYPLTYGREDRVLRLLNEAEIVIEPYGPVAAVGPGPP